MTIADCKRGRKRFLNDERYNRQMRKDPLKRAERMKRAIEKEQRMKARKKG